MWVQGGSIRTLLNFGRTRGVGYLHRGSEEVGHDAVLHNHHAHF